VKPLLALALLAGCATAGRKTDSDPEAGFRPLFDGKTLAGWRGYQNQPVRTWQVTGGVLTRIETPKLADTPRGFKVADGVKARVDRAWDLVTEEEFGDFELRLEWRISDGGNSGIVYRADETQEAPWMTGYECQVLDNDRHPDAKHSEGRRTAGALYDVYAPTKAARPAGQWNEVRIVARGNHLEHWLNGEKVVSADIGSDDWKAHLAASKWSKVPTYGTLARGRISLQDHGDKVEYRNIRIRVP
jgi:hypothetical protein